MSEILKVAKKVKVNKIVSKIITKPIRNTHNFDSKKFVKKYKINENFINNRQVLTLSRNMEFTNHIIYLHGGSFKDEALIVHKIFIERLLDNYDVKVTFLDYPLCPESNYKEIQDFVLKSFKYLKELYFNDKFYMIGDSAGGGLCLSFLIKLRDELNIKIDKSVLFSPWVDVSMTNTEIQKQIKKDFTLNYDDLVKSGLDYSLNLDPKNKIVSPIYNKLNDLGDFLIFVSDNELLYPDIIELDKTLNKSKNSSSKLIIGNDLCHDWPLLLIKESKDVIPEVIEFLFRVMEKS